MKNNYKTFFESYDDIRNKKDYFGSNVKKSEFIVHYYEIGQFDLYSKQDVKKFVQKIQHLHGCISETELEERYPNIEIEHMNIEHPNLKYMWADNTYNASFQGFDFNIKVYKDIETNEYIVLINVHGGGDIRGNYFDNIYYLVEDYDVNEIYSILTSCEIIIETIFKDNTDVVLRSNSVFDMYDFEIYKHDTRGLAQEFAEYFETLSGSDADDLVLSLLI